MIFIQGSNLSIEEKGETAWVKSQQESLRYTEIWLAHFKNVPDVIGSLRGFC